MPQNLGVVVEGRRRVVPGVTVTVDVENFRVPRSPLVKRALFIGPALGGEPQTFLRLTSDNYARVLKGGAILKALDAAVDPSSDTGGLGEFEFYRVNAAAAAAIDVGDLVVTALPTHAGLYGNNFALKRDTDAEDSDAVIVTVKDLASGTTEVSGSLGPALEIEYLGSGIATAQISESGGVKTLELSSDVGPEETHSLVLGEGGSRTFQALAEALSNLAAWSGTVLYQHHSFDAAWAPVGAITLTADVGRIQLGAAAQIAWFEASLLASAEDGGAAATGVDAGFLPFTGGSEGAAVTTQDYLDAFTGAAGRDVQAIWTYSTEAAVHVAGVAHAASMSHPVTRRERRFFCGPADAASKSAAATAALNLSRELSDPLATVVGTPIRKTNPRTGKLEVYSPNDVAAMAMAMACSVRPEVDLTYKTVKLNSLKYEYDEESDIRVFIEAGVWSLFYDWEDAVYRVADDVTSHQADSNLYKRLRFGVDVEHYLKRKLRAYPKQYVGQVGDDYIIEAIRNAANVGIYEEVRDASNREGVLRSANPVTAEFDGTEFVTLNCSAVGVGRIGHIVFDVVLSPQELSL